MSHLLCLLLAPTLQSLRDVLENTAPAEATSRQARINSYAQQIAVLDEQLEEQRRVLAQVRPADSSAVSVALRDGMSRGLFSRSRPAAELGRPAVHQTADQSFFGPSGSVLLCPTVGVRAVCPSLNPPRVHPVLTHRLARPGES